MCPVSQGRTMASPTEISVWATLLPVIVGGTIGLAGGLIGPWFIETRKQEAEKRKNRAVKFEEMVAALFEYEHWLDIVRDARLYSNVEKIVPTMPQSPSSKLHAISAIYFPEFQEKIQELERAGREYEKWM